MVVHRRIQGAAMNGTAAWRACNPLPSPCFVVFKTADESSRGLDQPFPPPSISRSFVPRHSFPSRGRMADPGRRNYGGLHGGSRTFYLGLRGTRLLGLCKCLSIFLFLMGAGNITTTRKMRMTMDGSKVAEFLQGVTCYKLVYWVYVIWILFYLHLVGWEWKHDRKASSFEGKVPRKVYRCETIS